MDAIASIAWPIARNVPRASPRATRIRDTSTSTVTIAAIPAATATTVARDTIAGAPAAATSVPATGATIEMTMAPPPQRIANTRSIGP